MTILTVGSGQKFSTISSAIAASKAGDVIKVLPGTYTNDWITVSHSLTIQGVRGPNGKLPHLVATKAPPNGFGLIDQKGGALTVQNLEISGAHLHKSGAGASNAAGVRFQNGTSLTLDHVAIHDNDDGVLANPVTSATIRITHSEIAHNGVGDDRTHNLYIGNVKSFVLDSSFVHDSNHGNEVKSRAATTTITNSVISSEYNYAVDLPNGGTGLIQDTVLRQGPHSPNSTIVAFGEEGHLHAATSLALANDSFLNELTAHIPHGVRNSAGGHPVSIDGARLFGMTASQLLTGHGSSSAVTRLGSEPSVTALGHALLN